MSTPTASRPPRPGLLARLIEVIPPEPAASPVNYSAPLVSYVAVVSALAVAVALLTVRAPFHLPTLAVGAMVIVALGLVMVRSFGGVSAAWSPIAFVHMALSLALGPPGALVAAVVASVASVIRLRTGWFRALLNGADFFLSNVAAWGAFHVVSQLDTHGIWIAALAGLAAGLASFIVNHAIVSVAIRLASSVSIWTILRSIMAVLPLDLAYGVGAAGIAYFYAQGGAVYLTMLLLPAVAPQGFLIDIARRTNAHNAERDRHSRERVELLQRVITAADDERFKTASDLHDGPVAHLSGLAFELDAAGQGHVADELRAVQRELRTQIYALSPHDLDQPGRLREEVTKQLEPLRERGVTINVEIPDAIPLERGAVELVHRVCGEALTNVWRHAHALHASVALVVSADEIVLTIDDDGRGFSADDVERQRAAGHFGTRCLAEKAEVAHGSFRLESEPGTGTHICLSLPAASARAASGSGQQS
jgi:signal transduction histidine kinase